MTSDSPTRRTFSVPALLAFGLLGAGGIAVVFTLVRFWGANPEYTDRFLILAASAVLVWLRREEILAHPAHPIPLGLVPLGVGAVAFTVGWYLQAQVSPKPVLLWLLVPGWLALAAGLVLLHGGWWHLRRLAFPLVFILFALPIPNRILVPLQKNLQDITTTVAASVLPAVGIPVQRSGFVLSLPSGDLGVAEACSGVRSVTALTAIAAFVAYWSGFGLVRGLILLGLSIPVIGAVNAFRVILSGLIQEHIGPEYINGDWHEALGIAMVVLGLGLIVLLAGFFQTKQRGDEAAADSAEKQPGKETGQNRDSVGHTSGSVQKPPAEESQPTKSWLAWTGTLMICVTAVAATAAEVFGTRDGDVRVGSAPLDDLPFLLPKAGPDGRSRGEWRGVDLPIEPYVQEMLTYDRALHRLYHDELGRDVDLWVIFWSSRNMVKGYHHPDICLGNKGYTLASRDHCDARVGAGQVGLTVREFTHPKEGRLYVLYWCQEGRRVWTDEDERAVQGYGDSHDWLGDRLLGRDAAPESGRLVVLISSRVSESNRSAREEVNRFAALVGEGLYRVCEWAAVPPSPSRSP